MSMLFLAAMLMAQAPSAVQPEQPVTIKKSKQVCQMVEVTGSRARKRVCRDANGRLDLGPGVSDTVDGKGNFDQRPMHSGPPGGPGAS